MAVQLPLMLNRLLVDGRSQFGLAVAILVTIGVTPPMANSNLNPRQHFCQKRTLTELKLITTENLTRLYVVAPFKKNILIKNQYEY